MVNDNTRQASAVSKPGAGRERWWPHSTRVGHPAAQLAGFALLVLFLVTLALALTRQPLPRAPFDQPKYDHTRLTHILVLPLLGLDFHHNYRAVKTWHGGQPGNPYARLNEDPANTRYVYPPLTLVAFTWAEMFPSSGMYMMNRADGTPVTFGVSVPAILIWLALSIAIIGFAARCSSRARADLGLPALPLSLILGATLLSYPVLFELERGNCNVWPLLAVAVLAGLMRKDPPRRDWAMGLCVAVAIGIKPYAIVLLPALLVLRRFRAAAWSLGWLALQGLILAAEFKAWLGVAEVHNRTETTEFMDWSHSLIGHWKLIWAQLGIPSVASLPPQATVTAALFVACGVVAWQVLKTKAAARATWPFFLWLLAVGTMLLPIAYDYNLLFVPLLLASTWQARDPWWVHVLAGLALVWLQPFYFGVVGLPLIALKVASVLSLGALVVHRVRQLRDGPMAVAAAPAAA